MSEPSADPSALLSAREAADYCGVTEKTIRNWLANGRLSAAKSAGVFRISREQLEPLRRKSAEERNGAERNADPFRSEVRGPEPGFSAADLLGLVERQQQMILELSGRCGYLQAELGHARGRILALEAPKADVSPTGDTSPAGDATRVEQPRSWVARLCAALGLS